MNCPHCGTWSSVRETRKLDRGLTLRRSRTCGNNHTFTSYEVLPAIYRASSRDRRSAVHAAEARALRAKRNAAIVKACATRTRASVAIEFGLTATRVKQIVAAACLPATPSA